VEELPPPPERRAGYEDWQENIPDPVPGAVVRPGAVTAAGVLLLVAGVLALLAAALILSSGDRTVIDGVSRDVVRVAGVVMVFVAGLEIVAGILVLRLSAIGRVLGLILAGLGIVAALGALATPTGVVTLAIDGFVIYALASSGDAFRRAAQR
jgi:hypothetical protein